MRKQPVNILSIPFKNKAIELLNLNSILNDSSVTSSIFKGLTNLETKSVTYTLGVFRFNKFVLSLELDAFDRSNSISLCYSADLCFIDKDCGHILRGNFRIVGNKNLKWDQNIEYVRKL